MTSRKLIKNILVFTFLLSFYFQAHAAVTIPEITSALPGAVDAGLMGKNIQENTIRHRVKALPIISNAPLPSTTIAGADKLHLTLTKVIIKGNTVFTDQQLQAIFATSINKKITLADLQNLVEAISVKYRDAGYILSRAVLPPQEIKDGIVKIDVIEGFISKVDIGGKPGRTKSLLEKYGQHIMQSKPLKLSVLEHEMLLANDLPGMTVKAVITPSKTIPSSADLTLIADPKIISGYLDYDNYSTRYLGPIETSIGLAANSVFFPGDTTGVNATVSSKESELEYYDFHHTALLSSNGLNLTVGTNYTQTQPEFLLDGLFVIGRSNSIYSNMNYPILRSRTQNLYVHGALNYQNVTSQILETPLYQDRVRSLSVGGAYNGTDSWGGTNSLGLDVIQGFEIMGADMHVEQSRPRGRARYTRSTATGSRIQPIYGRFSFFTSASGQFSFQPLLATEQYSFGGPIYGRGYGPSEIVGDRGIGAKAELRADVMPEWRFLQSMEYYLFYDGGVVWNLDNFDLPAKQSATSAGIGARFNFMPQLYGEVYIAKPLTRQDFTLTPPSQNPQQARAFFQLVARL